MNVVLDAIDQELEVYDRRTSKQVGKRAFSAGSTCASTLEARNDPSKELIALVDDAVIEAWLKTLLK